MAELYADAIIAYMPVCILAPPVLGEIVVLGGGDNEAPKVPKSEARRDRCRRPRQGWGFGEGAASKKKKSNFGTF